MPTIDELMDAKTISRIEVGLDAHEQSLRLLYGTAGFTAWLEKILGGAEPPRRLGDATPAEQIDQLFHIYVSGMPLIYTRQFRFIRAEKNAVWELKTPDIRIFGWFMRKDCFVAVFGDWADQVKDHDLYRGYRIAIRRLRRELKLDDDFCVQGITPGDVLSL
jgi:hypothetical protein